MLFRIPNFFLIHYLFIMALYLIWPARYQTAQMHPLTNLLFIDCSSNMFHSPFHVISLAKEPSMREQRSTTIFAILLMKADFSAFDAFLIPGVSNF